MAGLPRCPHCEEPLTETDVRVAAEEIGLRVTRIGVIGRPRSAAERCPCGANTLTRAKARSFACCKRAGVLSRAAGGAE